MNETKTPQVLKAFLELDTWASTWGNPDQYFLEMTIAIIAMQKTIFGANFKFQQQVLSLNEVMILALSLSEMVIFH